MARCAPEAQYTDARTRIRVDRRSSANDNAVHNASPRDHPSCANWSMCPLRRRFDEMVSHLDVDEFPTLAPSEATVDRASAELALIVAQVQTSVDPPPPVVQSS
jgi:hypothetical protein